MSAAKNIIVFQAYGNQSILNECVFSLLTFTRIGQSFSDLQVWIYTDNEAYFESFTVCPVPIHYRTIDASQIKEWRGATDFVHRVKIQILKDLAAIQPQANILYLDTDTEFLQPIDTVMQRIAKGQLFMHIDEGVIREEGNPILKKLNKFLADNRSIPVDDGTINVSDDAVMWNAGVLGFRAADAAMLNDVLGVTDVLHKKYQKHIIEQFAFSLIFQNKQQVKAAYPYIMHYWNLKEFRVILDSFFTYFKGCSWTELETYSRLLQVQVYIQQKANFYQTRSISKKIAKETWQPKIPDWDDLLKQL